MRFRRPVALGVAALIAAIVTAPGTFSAFTATNVHTGSMTSGSVSLTDNSSYQGSSQWDLTNLLPAVGSSSVTCLAVTYTGSVAAEIRSYMVTTGTLSQYLNIKVEFGTGSPSSPNSCTGFTATETVYNGTLNAVPSTWSTGMATKGGASWSTNEQHVYQYTVTIRDDAPNEAQNLTTNTTISVEARNV